MSARRCTRGARYGLAAIDLVRAAGVRHVVFSSALHTITDLIRHEIKRDVEQHLVSAL